VLSLLERNRQIVDIGAYVAGANPELDRALAQRTALRDFFSQREGGAAIRESLAQLANIARSLA
jgi:flagellum-specific ATP synthase